MARLTAKKKFSPNPSLLDVFYVSCSDVFDASVSFQCLVYVSL